MDEIYDVKSTGMISDLVKKLNLRAFSFNRMLAGQYLPPDTALSPRCTKVEYSEERHAS